IRRPPALDDNEKNALINEVIQDRYEPLHEVINTQEKHLLAHISWCDKYKEKTAYDWAQVIFSDESSVDIGKQSPQLRVFPRTVAKLKVALSEEWENLDCSIFEEVVASMPQRINAVLEARGGPTHY
ncbi:3634_t:CDS:2, partial [Funneliformis caledonium]